MTITVVSWNVNGLRARLPHVLTFLARHEPDVVCLQETKMNEAAVPLLAFAQLGYRGVADGKGGRAGVAILTRLPFGEVTRGSADREAKDLTDGRRLRARVAGVWIESLYVPTRKAAGKLGFLQHLERSYALPQHRRDSVLLCGDFNLCRDERDFASPSLITDAHLFPRREEDQALQRLLALGFTDCFRKHQDASGHYTWFDYRPWTLSRNYGMRLDYVFATPRLYAACVEVRHEMDVRRWEKPSDHVPVVARFGADAWRALA